jgi:hypothetical protein
MLKLILTHEVSGLGTPGDVIEVKNGYARNFLVPQGLAVQWTRGGEKQVESIKAARVARVDACSVPSRTPTLPTRLPRLALEPLTSARSRSPLRSS